ncbi:MAG: glutamate transport system permease protein [Acidimicrobiaceae bacterium]
MTAPVLADALGPRGRRRALVASIVVAIAVAFALYLAVQRLSDKGQLDWAKWKPLTDPDVLRFLFGGLGNTLKAAGAGMALALPIGTGLALLRLSRSAPVRWFATAWIELFRGVPLVLLIFFTFFGLPKYSIDVNPFRALVLALAVYNGAVLGEIFRAGILSLDRGQTEAAYAVGLRYWQAMRAVIIPQAARRMIPAIVSQLITLLKDTSLGYVITYEELLRRSRSTGEYFKNPLQVTVFVALLYIAVNLTLSRIAHRLEVRQRRRLGAGAIAAAGGEDLAAVGIAAEATVRREDG